MLLYDQPLICKTDLLDLQDNLLTIAFDSVIEIFHFLTEQIEP